MLVLSRKAGERIMIGKDIAITIVRISHGTVRIGIEAPRTNAILREEVFFAPENEEFPKNQQVEISLPDAIVCSSQTATS